jgi:hypothetical protein
LYLLFKNKHHDKFMEEGALKNNTNHVEGFNGLIRKFLPKDRTYCKTIETMFRIYLAMGIQSVGYHKFYM